VKFSTTFVKLFYHYQTAHCCMSNTAVECAQETSCLPTLYYAVIPQTLVATL